MIALGSPLEGPEMHPLLAMPLLCFPLKTLACIISPSTCLSLSPHPSCLPHLAVSEAELLAVLVGLAELELVRDLVGVLAAVLDLDAVLDAVVEGVLVLVDLQLNRESKTSMHVRRSTRAEE